jgi:serine/threonine protein kinase
MIEQAPDAEAIFLAALDKATPQERAAFVDGACAGNAQLLRRVRELLASHEESHGPLDAPPCVGATVDQPPIAERPGMSIGSYKLLQQIGEGAMGVVYMAEQQEPVRRKVALKVIKPGMDSAQVIARFEAERQALAMMDHQNIARVLDAGTTASGRPYFVMELVLGVPITTFCDDNQLTPRERLELFIPICHAIQHAHQKGIIHRDIKPSNVLVTMYDDKPVPKVIDFGVAKAVGQRLTEKTLFTELGALVGTFEYMSPEQAEINAFGVDTRSDIYSLGVLLYELLTGATPLEKKRVREATLNEVVRLIKEEEPPRPSVRLSSSGTLAKIAAARKTEPAQLAKLVRGELDWIVMKSLEKDRSRRYETANAMAQDVQRYLTDEPVQAGPPSATYRVRKLARKHKAALVIAGAFVLLLASGMAVSAWQALKATWAERRMQAERDLAQMALTCQVAERLDGEMKQLAAVASTIEAGLAQQDWQQDHLAELLEVLLRRDDRIHGLTLAYEEGKGPKNEKDYCLYVCRDLKDPKKINPPMNLLPEKGYPLYRNWDWYKKPLKEDKAQWTGPGFDGAPDAKFWMISYSLPMKRNRQPVGVLTVDLRMEYFKQVWPWLRELNIGESSYGFVVNGTGISDGTGADSTGAFVSHPKYGPGDREDQPPGNITDLGAIDSALAQRILQGETGRGTGIDPATSHRLTFLFHPVRSTGWSFVAVIEE